MSAGVERLQDGKSSTNGLAFPAESGKPGIKVSGGFNFVKGNEVVLVCCVDCHVLVFEKSNVQIKLQDVKAFLNAILLENCSSTTAATKCNIAEGQGKERREHKQTTIFTTQGLFSTLSMLLSPVLNPK